MRDKHLDRLIERAGSKYTLVVAVAKRAQQIRDGKVPLVDIKSNNPVTLSLVEIATREVLVNPEDLIDAPVTEEGGVLAPSSLEDEDLDLFAGMDLDGDVPGDDVDDDEDDEEL